MRGPQRLCIALLSAGLCLAPLSAYAAMASHTAASEAPPPCNGHPRNAAGFVVDGFAQCPGPPGHELQWCVGTPTDIDNCDAAMHHGFITSGRPQLSDDKCVGSDLDRQNCYAARRHMSTDVYLASLRVVVAGGAGVRALNYTGLAECESGNTNANTGNGFYGYFQFDAGTWQGVTGLAGVASNYGWETQVSAVSTLYAQRGSAPWPSCGWRLLA